MKDASGYLAAASLGIFIGAIVGHIVGGYLPSYTFLEIRKTMVADKEDK
jgi:Na+/glutamate symporter